MLNTRGAPPSPRTLTLMTRRSSSTRILGLTWIWKGPPLCRPSASTTSPYSSSVC